MKKIRIFALIAAVAMFISAYMLIKEKEAEEAAALNKPDTVTMTRVVAARDIRPYSILTAENLTLETVEVPAGEEATDCFASLDEVSGRVAFSDIFEGEVITEKRALLPEDERLGLSMHIEEGMRAITLSVGTEQAVGYHLEVGDRVDIIFTRSFAFETTDSTGEVKTQPAGKGMAARYGRDSLQNTVVLEDEEGNTASTIALENLRVAAIAGMLSGRTSGAEYGNITLEVTPEEAAEIALMESTGSLRIVLRALSDEEEANFPRTSVYKKYTEAKP